ncbi:PaaI family thioesterase [Nocardia altamirensis]|uniref:PaaI family thioesterase n=1 Tax=Nocardia altamirensis TaxID=472158 RepID=UPI0008406EBC|nr:PaaI family thioesterase [Nocardia altamirensis]
MTDSTMTDPWGSPRTKTVTWYDPAALVAAATGMSGLEFLRAMSEGKVPPAPISSLVAPDWSEMNPEPGKISFSCTVDESTYNANGLVHGGLACTLLDTAVGCAVQTTLPAGVGYTSVELKVNYLRPLRPEAGPLRVVGRVTKPGRRITFAEAEIRDAEDALLATASSSCLILGG